MQAKNTLLSKKLTVIFILLLMIMQFSFGFYKIQKEAYVDEALWVYDRIPRFWQNLDKHNWKRTRRSDKPGVTVMYISGIGLLNKENLINCKTFCPDTQKLEIMLRNLRTPIFLCFTLFIPLLFFLLNKLFQQKIALLSTTLVALSPILLGMSRIVNPDALLWIFTTGAILFYLIFLKFSSKSINHKFILLSGFFMGLALLTKYVANILFVFVLVLPFLNYIFTKQSIIPAKYFKQQLFAYFEFVLVAILTVSVLYPVIWVEPNRLLLATVTSQAFASTWKAFALLLTILSLDIIVFKSFLTQKIIAYLKQYSLVIKKILAAIFITSFLIVLLNVLLKNPLFDFSNILASPKSSHRNTNSLFFYLTNFYPLLFGITPLALLAILANSVKTILQKKETRSFQQSIFFILLFFILFYYFASLLSGVAGTIRYQIILYPLVLIMAGISFMQFSPLQNKKTFTISFLVLIFFLLLPLYRVKPYYISYVSSLLPNRYYLDHKDMGIGSYAAASYLNSLPNAEKLRIWSDKKGVCVFFVGYCSTESNSKKIRKNNYDYYVVSSGRKNLISRKFKLRKNKTARNIPAIEKLYSQNNYIHIINPGNRPENFVKIFPVSNVY